MSLTISLVSFQAFFLCLRLQYTAATPWVCRFCSPARRRYTWSFAVGDAQALPIGAATFDVAISGLVLNFVPDPLRMVTEMVRVVRQIGIVALYVWDYADKMEMIRSFWDAAVALNPFAYALDEGVRFPICKPERLAALFRKAGLDNADIRNIDIRTDFAHFDDYWLPFW